MRSDHTRWLHTGCDPVRQVGRASPFASCAGTSLNVLVELAVSPAARRELADGVVDAPGWLKECHLAAFLAEMARRDATVGAALEAVIRRQIGAPPSGQPVRSVASLAAAWSELRGAWQLGSALELLLEAAMLSSVAARKLELTMAFELRRRAFQALADVGR